MNLSNNTVLLTGGASGIGLALAQRLRQAGSEVIICGRRADKLREAQQQVPGLHIYETDLAQAADRIEHQQCRHSKPVSGSRPALRPGRLGSATPGNRHQL
jgi:short-subunit dehydrogenase involved in D-alanine esterification of teichoic acids